MAIPVVFSTGSLYPFGLERVYALAAEAGYDGVEIMMDERWDTHQDYYLNGLAEKNGSRSAPSIQPLFRGAWNLDPTERHSYESPVSPQNRGGNNSGPPAAGP